MALITWTVSVMQFGAGISNWSKMELESIDRKTRTLATVYGILHPRSDVDRLYLPRKCGDIG